MKFQLDFSIPDFPEKISYQQQITLLGSCFAQNIGQKFSQNKFHSLANPYGIIFNPISLAHSISEILQQKKYSESDLICYGSIYSSLSHHGSFSSGDKNSVVEKINREIENANSALKKCGWLIVTFGSAYAYKYRKTGTVVANCHKIPNTEFEKIFLSAEEIISQWKNCISELREINPGLKIIFTVSPVRYIRDGLVENNKSKAALLTAVHEICSSQKNCIYFPAYEIVNDVLRDYRFFKEDMVHPTQQAIDFVWEKFSEIILDEETKKILPEIESFNKLNSHRSLLSEKENEFSEKVKEQKEILQKRYPELNWD